MGINMWHVKLVKGILTLPSYNWISKQNRNKHDNKLPQMCFNSKRPHTITKNE